MKKKILLSLMISMLSIFVFGSINISAATSGSCGDNVSWNLSGSTLTISGSGKMKTYSQASEVPWFSSKTSIRTVEIKSGVTSIGAYAFFNSGNLTRVVIPNSVTSIENTVFFNCTNLKSIAIPDSVKTIGVAAFSDCTNLTSVNLGNGITAIDNSLFAGCKKLETINIPNSVKMIGNSAFSGCSKLQNIEIPSSITSIGNNTFYNCTELANVVISSGVRSIGDSAFGYCKNLTSITIPESVTSIGVNAFSNCTSIKNVYYTGTVSEWHSINFGSGNEKLTSSEIIYCYGDLLYSITSGEVKIVNCDTSVNGEVIIPSTIAGYPVTSIGDNAFLNCESLSSISIPDSVTSIGEGAFLGTSYYENSSNWQDGVLYIGKHLVSVDTAITGNYKVKENTIAIADCAFENCSNLTNVIIPYGIINIPYSAFYGCNNLTSITIPDSVVSIEGYAFYNCSGLTSISIPEGITSIEAYTFYNCSSLNSITIPDGVTSIDRLAFYCCSSLTSVIIPNSVASIANMSFYNCSSINNVYYKGTEAEWNSISIGHSNTPFDSATIHYNYKEFLDCVTYVVESNEYVRITGCDTDIAGEISIPATIDGYPVTIIDYNAFKGCDRITSVVFPESVTDIYGSAFENCTGLASVTFTDNVTWLGGSVFGNCTSLTSVTLPANLSFVGDRAFYGCTNLKSIEIDENNSEFSSIDGNLFNKQATTMLQYSIGKSESAYIIPDGVTMIDTYCFEDCVNLSSITIPESIQEIRMTAFRDCPNIKNVYYYGTQDEWNKVLIGTYNDGLTGATIHFIKPRTETVLSNNDKTFTITPINIATGNTVILALYNGTALVEMQSLVYNGEPIPFTTTKDYANAKVFVWENFETLVPICEAEIVK